MTVTVNLQLSSLPAASLNMYDTVVTPFGNVDPGAWLRLKYATDPSQLSVAVGSVQVAIWSHVVLPAPVYTIWFEGQPVIAGGVLSMTVTVNLQLSELPAASLKM